MEDKSFNINLGVADVIEEIKDTKTASEVDATSALLVRAIHAALSPLEKWVMQKEYNVAATKKLLEAKLQNVPIENIITPPPYVAVPALQAISYCMDDDQLREMFAELLAHAMNSETVDNVHPTYVEIIKQMSPYDALVFKKLIKQLVVPCIAIKYVNKENGSSYPIYDLVVFTDFQKHPLVPTQICLENLERLHLIEINRKSKLNANGRYQMLEACCKQDVEKFIEDNKGILYPEAYEVLYNEFVIELRGFGQFFARACLGENFQNVD